MIEIKVFMIEIKVLALGQADLCEPVLRLLPEWFGVESALTAYVRAID